MHCMQGVSPLPEVGGKAQLLQQHVKRDNAQRLDSHSSDQSTMTPSYLDPHGRLLWNQARELHRNLFQEATNEMSKGLLQDIYCNRIPAIEKERRDLKKALRSIVRYNQSINIQLFESIEDTIQKANY